MVKSFDTVDRDILDCAMGRLGLPAWFRKREVRLRFKLAAGLKVAWTREPTHRTDSMTYLLTTSHISLKIPSVFKPLHNNMVRSEEERFAMERMATRGFGSKKDRGTAWCAGGDNEALAGRGCAWSATWRRATWCGGWCVRLVFFACFGSHVSNCA